MDHRRCFSGSPGTTGLRLEARNEADVDDGAPEADHPVTINLIGGIVLRRHGWHIIAVIAGASRRLRDSLYGAESHSGCD